MGVDIGEIAGTHGNERPTRRGVDHAAAIGVAVVCRGAEMLVLGGMVGIGAPRLAALPVCIIEVRPPEIGIDLIGDRREENRDPVFLPSLRQHEDRNDVLAAIHPKPHAVDTAGERWRNDEVEIDLPEAVVQVVLMEMDGGIVARRVPPAHLVAGPERTPDAAGRQVEQTPIHPERAAIPDDRSANIEPEIPPGDQPRIGFREVDGSCHHAFQDGRIFEPPVEETAICRSGQLRRKQDGMQLGQRSRERQLHAANVRATPSEFRRGQGEPVRRDGKDKFVPLMPGNGARKVCDPPAELQREAPFAHCDGSGFPRSEVQPHGDLPATVQKPRLHAQRDGRLGRQRNRRGRLNDPAGTGPGGLETRRIGSGEVAVHLVEPDTGAIGIRVRRDDPHEVCPVARPRLARDLQRNYFTRSNRIPVRISDDDRQNPLRSNRRILLARSVGFRPISGRQL